MLNIKSRRIQSGMSQTQFAAALNVKQSTVSYWESGKSHPRAMDIPRIAKVLGCTINDLYEADQKQDA